MTPEETMTLANETKPMTNQEWWALLKAKRAEKKAEKKN